MVSHSRNSREKNFDIEEGQDEEELDFNDEDFTIDFDEMSDEE